MRKITRSLVWLFVFSVPWGVINAVLGIGTITRLIGIAAIGLGALTTIVEGRLRKPGVLFWLALVFAISGIVSTFWTISDTYTNERVGTYLQFVGLLWVVREFARTREQQDWLMLAFCLGSCVLAVDLLGNFNAGVRLRFDDSRYSAAGTNPNYVGFTLVMGFPMAWYLFRHYRGTVRMVAAMFCLVAPIALLLTAGRASFLGGCIALSIIPLTLRRESLGSLLRMTVVLAVAGVIVAAMVPSESWKRLLTIKQEVEGGTMSGRTVIWDAGWRVFSTRPILGIGAGAFPAAVEPELLRARAAHNMVLALLVEQGIVGLALFTALLGGCVWMVVGLPPTERKLWAVILLAWLIIAMSADSHSDKVTWVLFALLSAQTRFKDRADLDPTRGRARIEDALTTAVYGATNAPSPAMAARQ